ncbi:MAG TPA: hypothetical protein VFX82_07055, partial [Desulfobacterales bacterium]|nr:hypothetical protein [Desulfobacterales bacterium]
MTCERFHGPSRKGFCRSHRGFFRNRLSLIGVILIFALAGCETTPKPVPPAAPAPPEAVSLKKLSPSSYPNFADDLDYNSLGQAIAQSIAYLQVVPPQREVEFGR